MENIQNGSPGLLILPATANRARVWQRNENVCVDRNEKLAILAIKARGGIPTTTHIGAKRHKQIPFYYAGETHGRGAGGWTDPANKLVLGSVGGFLACQQK